MLKVPKVTHRFNTIPIKNSVAYFGKIDKRIVSKCNKLKMAKIILKKKKNTTYYETTVVKKGWNGLRIDMWVKGAGLKIQK